MFFVSTIAIKRYNRHIVYGVRVRRDECRRTIQNQRKVKNDNGKTRSRRKARRPERDSEFGYRKTPLCGNTVIVCIQ